MKKIILALMTISALSCKSQNPVVGLDAPSNTPEGAYLKDLNNEMNKFVGTWKLNSGGKEFTITLEKREMIYGYKYYKDRLEGEYSFKENGQEIVNTFPINPNESNIGGSSISLPNEYPKCDNCNSNERRIDMYFIDPERKYLNSRAVIRYIAGTGSNPDQISVKIYQPDMVILPYDGASQEPRVPYGEYLLTKQ